jgi:hypothetical protein
MFYLISSHITNHFGRMTRQMDGKGDLGLIVGGEESHNAKYVYFRLISSVAGIAKSPNMVYHNFPGHSSLSYSNKRLGFEASSTSCSS